MCTFFSIISIQTNFMNHTHKVWVVTVFECYSQIYP